MALNLELINFEGPLDLLLQLIERAQIEVTDISLSDITGQYLDYISQLADLQAGELDQFVDLASRLLLLKSQALLPDLRVEHETAMAELTEQLSQYGQYRQAAIKLAELLSANPYRFERQAAPSRLAPEQMPPVELATSQLHQLFAAALERLPAPTEQLAVTNQLTIKQAISRLVERGRRQRQFKAIDLLNDCRHSGEVVAIFLAILELIKEQVLAVSQAGQFHDITISYAG